MTAEKDDITQQLRISIIEDGDHLLETDRADLLLVTLSFQSRTRPERHVWIDTEAADLGHGYAIDLEDWTDSESWDNSVATVTTSDANMAREITHSWLRGDTIDDTLALDERAIIRRAR